MKELLVLLLFFQGYISGFAQINPTDTNLPLRKLMGTDNFIPENISGIIQDSTGFVWIGTQQMGLFRYDGKFVKQYKNEKANPASIAYNTLYQLYQDSRNRLWLFYLNGEFDIFDPLTEKVRHLSAELGVARKIEQLQGHENTSSSFWHSRSLYEDSRHRMWMVADRYVACVDEAGRGSIEFYVNTWPGIAPSSVLSVNQTAGGNLLLVTVDQILEADAQNRIVRRTPLPFKMSNRSERYYNSMNIRKGDTLYAACPKGVVAYAINSGAFVLRGGLPATCIDIKTVTSPASDRFLFYDRSRPNRLYEFVTGSGGFSSLGSYPYPADTIMNEEKLFYLYDKYGNLWHGLFGSSVYYGSVGKKPFTLEKLTYDPTLQLLEHFLNIPESITRKIKVMPGYPIVGTPAGAALYVDLTHRFVPFIPPPYGTNRRKPAPRWTVNVQGDMSTLMMDDRWKDGKVWGYDATKKELFTIDTLGRSVVLDMPLPARVTLQSFATSDNNTCWMTFLNMPGLALFQPGKGFIKVITGEKGAHPLPNIRLESIIRDNFNKHVFWITTAASGVLRFDERDESWELLGEKEGFASNVIGNYLQDRLGYFWYVKQSGLYRFDSRTRTHLRIASTDQVNIPGFNFDGGLGHLLENEIYWASGSHIIVIKTDSLEKVRETTVAFTGLRVNNQTVTAGDSTGLMAVAIDALPILELAYDQNFLHFQFAALEYNQPADVRYRHQLEGVDKGWVDNGPLNETQYTSLPPGRYLFKVNATNSDGTWSKEIKSIRVVISPPWWRTWWMYAIYALVLIGAGWLFMKTRLRRLQLRQQVVLKQKEAEQAHAMEETKSRFFANITHELRTPLTLILSPVQRQLQEGPTTYSPQLLTGVYRNSQILLRLINQLLDMSKLESGQMPVTLSRGNLIQFVDGLLNSFRQQAATRQINLQYKYADLQEDCLFDSDKLEKIVYNLLSNAFKFTPDGGTVAVTLRRTEEVQDSDGVAVVISDSGIGIAPGHLPHIFNRFYQVNTSTTRTYEGTGIGLSLVKELVDLMGGAIHAQSLEGQGSTFSVLLPLAVAGQQTDVPLVNYPVAAALAPLEEATTIDIVPGEATNKPLILVTEDNEELRRFIADSLSSYYQVLTASQGQVGFEMATAELPDLIISDVMMPVMNGYEFCQKIKETPLTSHIGFVLLTAKMAEESRLSGLRIGADHYLSKPFNVEELLLIIGNLLKRQQKLKEHYNKQLWPAGALPPIKEVEDKFLQSVYAVIETNLDSDKLDVDFLASQMAVSRRTLNRKLSSIADTSANEVIRNYRLKKAAELLLKGEAVSSAAYATGFSTPSWFSQCFKELYGLSPAQYAETGGMSRN